MEKKYPLPPFTLETAREKIQMAENAWNTKDPEKVCMAYTVKAFLQRKWERELDYKLKKELWIYQDNRIAVRFEYEWHNAEGQWFRSYGNENWEFDENGLMKKRFASINDLPINEQDRKFR